MNDLRYFKDMVNMDDGIMVDFSSVPKDIKAFVMVSKFLNVPSFLPES